MIQKGKRHLTLNSPPSPREQPQEDNANASVLSAKQVKRLIRKRVPVYLAVLKKLDDMPSALCNAVFTLDIPSTTLDNAGQLADIPAVQLEPPAGQQASPGSKVPWVAGMFSEYADVFEDPLPPGLPPVRTEGHAIPTEPGHPPPFRSMYRLSPLEYAELV